MKTSFIRTVYLIELYISTSTLFLIYMWRWCWSNSMMDWWSKTVYATYRVWLVWSGLGPLQQRGWCGVGGICIEWVKSGQSQSCRLRFWCTLMATEWIRYNPCNMSCESKGGWLNLERFSVHVVMGEVVTDGPVLLVGVDPVIVLHISSGGLGKFDGVV